ncbi:apolipoprotein N-acyltransferase [Pseudooceanicola sp. CBS1P-1]|uniref:Apolipoprotein N-acyltransferase n=1 Tax=Pseudooceanicola albus TaxID=2692189 RepID=A0A6L7G6L4_9RHOB|nr:MULTISPECIES: apolipoprotein N-acyltransferase [Pseudooceanicola]MBT9384612.1 apolipoprotein N-acyltransferase [Pseudooceanicola endophyticus]MXN18313.1 apolipoprotein N-acyltransferase [Pseudooceanicola albus]
MALPIRLKSWWPAAAGLLAACGEAPLNLWPLSIAGFALLFHAQRRSASARQGFGAGWRFGFGYFLFALFWIVDPFMVDPARDGWMAPFALVFMAGGLALFWGAALALAQRLAPANRLRQLLAFAGSLTLIEALRGWIFTGFPWAEIGQNLIPSPALPLASLIGPHGMTLVLLLLAGLLGAAARGMALLGVLGTAGFVFLAPRALPPAPVATDTAPLIRLVQPNAQQREKWDPDMVPVFFERLLNYSAEAPRPDLILWPETSVPYLLNEGRALTSILADHTHGAPIAFGVQRTEGARYYNSLALLDGQGKLIETYDKHHLVPFGEYIPFGDLMAKIGISAFAAQSGNGFSAGPGPRLMPIPGVGTALPLICYEAIFPRDIRNAPARPDFLLQVTNDGWFGNLQGPYQHLAQARMRAAEQGLPFVRVANTGVSALIDARGQVLDTLPLNTDGYLDVRLPPALPPTLYARTGDLPILLLAFLALGVSALWSVHRAFIRRS